MYKCFRCQLYTHQLFTVQIRSAIYYQIYIFYIVPAVTYGAQHFSLLYVALVYYIIEDHLQG